MPGITGFTSIVASAVDAVYLTIGQDFYDANASGPLLVEANAASDLIISDCRTSTRSAPGSGASGQGSPGALLREAAAA